MKKLLSAVLLAMTLVAAQILFPLQPVVASLQETRAAVAEPENMKEDRAGVHDESVEQAKEANGLFNPLKDIRSHWAERLSKKRSRAVT